MLTSSRDDGLRSLRCCKRRSVVSNLRDYGRKWASSRLRIAVIHPEPIRSSARATFSERGSSSDLALAAVAGLSIQGHAVSLYASGYREKDIPEYFWDSGGDLKACVPRILRLAFFPSHPACSEWVTVMVSLIITCRIVFDCLITFLINLVWWVLPGSSRPRSVVLDVVITFGRTVLPHALLSKISPIEILHFPTDLALDHIIGDNFLSKRFFNLSRCTLVVATTDSESMEWSKYLRPSPASLACKVVTVYAPVVAGGGCCNLKAEFNKQRPFFASLAWYRDTSDVLIAIEAFSIFLSLIDGEKSCEEVDGCTGSGTVSTLPLLVIILGTRSDQDQQLLILTQEIKRLNMTDHVSLETSSSAVDGGVLLENCIAVIHTPRDINQVRVPCAAMLAGRPVITTTSFSLMEPVRHESTGIIVKTRSATLIAQAIHQIFSLSINRPAELNRMGLRGRQRVLTEFSIEMFGSRLDDALGSL